MSADKDNDGEANNNNNGRGAAVGVDGDDVDESHLPPGMRRRAREAMQNAHAQAQQQQNGTTLNRSSAYTGVAMMDLPPIEDATNSNSIGSVRNDRYHQGQEMMTPREAGGNTSTATHRNFTNFGGNNGENISTVYDDILNQDQFGGASAVDTANGRRW